MKRFFAFFILTVLFASPCFAKKKEKDELTLRCSCIAAKTDFHVQLEPVIVKNNGYAYRNDEIVGKVFPKNSSLRIMLDGATELFYDADTALCIYRMPMDDMKPWSCYGTCEAANYQELKRKDTR